MRLTLLQVEELIQEGGSVFWLWIAAGGFILATIWFIYLAATGTGSAHHYVASTVIVFWAGLWYVVMATGGGIAFVEGPGGEPVTFYYARYIDWTLTTPLLLLGLVWLAAGGRLSRVSGLAMAIVIADVIMILTGVVAGATPGVISGIFFVISAIFFLAVLALLWFPLRSVADQGETEGGPGLFYTLSTMLTILWILYPVVWLVGTEGAGLVTSSWEVFFFAVLDVLAKIAFGVVLLGGIRRSGAPSAASGGSGATSRVS